MSYNRKQLKAGPLEKKKSNPYKKDVIVDQMGQWKYPGEITKIMGDASGTPITMQGVGYPVLGEDNLGNQQMMYPGQEYMFPGNSVTEYPQFQKGGATKIYTDKAEYVKALNARADSANFAYNFNTAQDNIFNILPEYKDLYITRANEAAHNDPRVKPYWDKAQEISIRTGILPLQIKQPNNKEVDFQNKFKDLALIMGVPQWLLNYSEGEKHTGKIIDINRGKMPVITPIYKPLPQVVIPVKKQETIVQTPVKKVEKTVQQIPYKQEPVQQDTIKRIMEKKYFFQQGNKQIPITEEEYKLKVNKQFQNGGWLEKYAKGGQLKLSKRPRTAKNIKTSMNELFLKNYNLYGPPGKRIYSPLATVQDGGTIYNTDNNSWLSNLYNGFEQLNTNADGNRNHIAELFTYPFQAGLRLAGSFTGDYSYGNITDPMSYLNSGLDILSVAPGGKLLKPIGKILGTESGVLSNTYKINPWAEKLKNPNSSYRVAGLDAYDDFKNTGILRSATPNVPEGASLQMRAMYRPTSFPSFQKGYADLRYLPEEGGVVFKTDLPTYKRGDINPVTGFPIKGRHYAHRPIDMNTGKTITELPAKDVKVFNGRPHWLKGYQELIKKQSGGQSTSTAPIVPKQFLTPEQREIVARQHGMDQGEIKQYDDSFSNNLFQFANKIDRGGLDPLAGLITDPMKSVANLMKPKEHAEAYGPLVGSALYAANVFDILPETKLSKFGSKELKDRIMKQRIVEGFEKVPVSGAFNKGVWMSKRQPDFVIKDVPFEHTIDEFYKPEYRNPEKFLEDYRKAFSKVPPSTGYSKVLQVSDPTPGVPIRDLVLSELQTRQTGKNYADYFKDYLPSEGIPINLLQFDKQNQLVEKMLPELRKFRDVGNYLKDEGLTWENAGSNIIYDDVRNKLSAIDLIPTSMMKPRSDTGLENLLPRLFYKTKTIGPKDFTDQIIQGNLTEKKANELMDNYKRVIEKAGIKLGRDPYDMDKGLGKYFPTQFVKEGDKFQTGGWLESYK